VCEGQSCPGEGRATAVAMVVGSSGSVRSCTDGRGGHNKVMDLRFAAEDGAAAAGDGPKVASAPRAAV